MSVILNLPEDFEMKDTAKMVNIHADNSKNGNVGYALAQAVEMLPKEREKGKKMSDKVKSKPIANPTTLPILDEEVSTLTESEIEEATIEATMKKEWAEKAGERLYKLKRERQRIYSTPGWDIVPGLVKLEANITANITKIEDACDDALRSHVDFSEFLNFIRGVERQEHMAKVVKYLIADVANNFGETRYRIATNSEVKRLKSVGKFPKTAFFWSDKCYLPYGLDDNEKKSSGQIAIEREVMKAIRLLSRKKSDELYAMDANDDLSGILDGVPGLYRIQQDSDRDEKGKKKSVRYSGVAIVRLSDRGKGGSSFFVIEPVDGAGSLRWLCTEKGKWWLSVSSAIFAKVPWQSHSDETEEEAIAREDKWAFISQKNKNNALHLARVLNKGLFPIWKEREESGKK